LEASENMENLKINPEEEFEEPEWVRILLQLYLEAKQKKEEKDDAEQ